MIKLYLKNWILNIFPYILLILAIISIGVILAGVSISVSTSIITNTKINGINVEAGKFSNLTKDIFDFYFSNPKEIVKHVLNIDAIKDIVIDNLSITEEEANVYSKTMIIWNYIAMSIIILHIILAYLITNSLLRKKLCPRSIKRFIIVLIVKRIIDLVVINSIALLMTKYDVIAIISFIVSLILNTILTLFLAYLSQHQKNDNIKVYNVINHKTIPLSLIMSILITSLAFVIYILLTYLIGVFALIIALPLLLYSFIITNLTPETYVINYKKIAKS